MPTDAPRIAALLVAAGTGQRLGGEVPKAYRTLAGQPLIRRAAQALLAHPAIHRVQPVIHRDHAARYHAVMGDADARLASPVAGGATRAESVLAGLESLRELAPDYVLVHDAARPLLPYAVLETLIAALSPESGVIPTLAVTDTVRRHTQHGWSEVPRDGLRRVQTPQGFPYAALRDLARRGADVTDEAALWLSAGGSLREVAGDEALRKITHEDDLAWAERMLAQPRRTVSAMGYDVHRLIPAAHGTIRLAGVDLPHTHALEGHSDADVALHALTDALLATISAGDIGSHFPPGDPQWAGADSALFVREACAIVRAAGGHIEHAGLTIVAQMPKIGPYRAQMIARVAQLLQIPPAHVSVAATTTEGLGLTGRREGIAANAIASVSFAI